MLTKLQQTLYLGIAVRHGANRTLDVGIAIHDGTYSIDFKVSTFKLTSSSSTSTSGSGSGSGVSSSPSPPTSDPKSRVPISEEELPSELSNFVIDELGKYQKEHCVKFVGAGINEKALQLSPRLAALMWEKLDIVPLVLPNQSPSDLLSQHDRQDFTVDEEADSMVRKALA